jgi:predicted lipoprotein
MSAAADAGGSPARRTINLRLVVIVLAVVVVAAMALDTTYKKPGEVTASGRKAFDPARYGATTFPRAVKTLEKDAVPITQLLPAIAKNADAAGKQYGKRQGTSPWNFSTSGEGVAGKAQSGIMPVKIDGLPKGTRVSLQVGPAINGTAIRDAVGFISFGQFTNQVEYAGAGTALNNQVKAKVLKGIDPAGLQGKRVSFTGAFTLLTPQLVTITPVKLQVSG